MITVGMNYHVIAGKQAAFEEKFAAVLNALRSRIGPQQFESLERRQRRRLLLDNQRMVRGASFR